MATKKIDPFHLLSTPVPLLPTLGIETHIGLSGEDPEGKRLDRQGFAVWLTAYSPKGQRARRWKIGDVAGSARRFFNLSALTKDFGFQEPHLCAVHRVPADLNVTDAIDEL